MILLWRDHQRRGSAWLGPHQRRHSAWCNTGRGEADRGPRRRAGADSRALRKEAILRGLDMPLEQALRYETDLTVILQTTDDRAEGVKAFIEKRNPKFDGR